MFTVTNEVFFYEGFDLFTDSKHTLVNTLMRVLQWPTSIGVHRVIGDDAVAEMNL